MGFGLFTCFLTVLPPLHRKQSNLVHKCMKSRSMSWEQFQKNTKPYNWICRKHLQIFTEKTLPLHRSKLKTESESYSVVSASLGSLRLQPTRLLCPWNFPGKNTGVGCHSVLQGIFPTQGSNPSFLHLLHWQEDFFFNHCISLTKPYYLLQQQHISDVDFFFLLSNFIISKIWPHLYP